jgi:rifampicin phosphotransferase
MKKLPFAWLGSKRAKKQGAGDKAGLLDTGRRLGLPVPSGVILLHRVYDLLLEAGVIVKEDNHFDHLSASRIHCPDPRWLKQVLHEDVRLPPLKGRMIVRAAFADGDGNPFGPIAPIPDVDFDQPQAVAAAFCQLWTAVADQPDTMRRDLIIQELISIRSEGVVFSDPAYQDDLLSISSGQYPALSKQYAMDGECWLLPQLRSGESAGEDLPEFAQRLQMLLRGVRRTFGRRAWRVEWADDGEICWLLQVNPLTQPPARSDQFVPLPLLGLPPALLTPAMGEQIVTACGDLYTLLRRLDKSLPNNRALVKLEEERPLRPAQCRLYINQSLLTDTLRHWGLATIPVHTWLDTKSDRSFERRGGRVLRRGPLMLRLAARQLWTASQAPRQTARWRKRAEESTAAEAAVTLSQLCAAALTAHLFLLGPISPDHSRLAQARTIWQAETAVAIENLCRKLAVKWQN